MLQKELVRTASVRNIGLLTFLDGLSGHIDVGKVTIIHEFADTWVQFKSSLYPFEFPGPHMLLLHLHYIINLLLNLMQLAFHKPLAEP